ncbi:MAG TPA: DNA cytosine methyltransferase [Pirellulales bacterium]|nr:DNA cytosine methyltransferase [Pirellulales bacterium]
MLVLSLFPGIGLLDRAFEEEGFCVVRGPDVLWGGDILRFHPPIGKFDGVIGGPPCQAFSSLARLVRASGREPRFGNLIPEFERCVLEASPSWFLMENVPGAPLPQIAGYGAKSFKLCNSHLAADGIWGQEQRRVRRITFGRFGFDSADVPSLMRWVDLALFVLPDALPTATQWTPDNSPGAKVRHQPVAGGHLNGAALTARRRERKNAVTGSTSLNPGCTGTSKAAKARAKAVSSSNGGMRLTPGAGNNGRGRYRYADACRLQGLPEDFLEDSPFTAEGKLKAVANGVPLSMGRAIARAVMQAVRR